MSKNIDSEKFEQFAKCIIACYGFNSNTKTGFSCIVPDPICRHQGLLIWNYSTRYQRFETQFQKFFSPTRLSRMKGLGFNRDHYMKHIADATISYQLLFLEVPGAELIGQGISQHIDNRRVFNVGIKFQQIVTPAVLKQLEFVLTQNEVVRFLKDQKYQGNKYWSFVEPKQLCVEKILGNF